MKDDAVIKDNEAVYLLNEQTYLHLRENLQGVGYGGNDYEPYFYPQDR